MHLTRPDLFVPQGMATRDYYRGTDVGTWYGHELTGNVAADHTRDPFLKPGNVALPSLAASLL